jgi:pyridoxal phosphate enzyme (YggS family)
MIMSPIPARLQAVRAAIAEQAHLAGREPQHITLLAVSKTFGAPDVLQAVQAGQRAFGENYLQEALDKMAEMRILAPTAMLEWHFIGPIQSNKTAPIAQHFDWVHTVERVKIAQRLSDQRPLDKPPLNICLQVNISGETSKSGVAPADLLALAQAVRDLPGVKLRGLMAIPAPCEDFTQQRQAFARLRELYQQLGQSGFALDTLSMGMSADMGAAIFEGSTMVRVGSAIFGAREHHSS